MRVALTDQTIRNLTAPERGQRLYFDRSLPGFGVRVSARGTKTFTLVHGANREFTKIGRYPIVGLAAAREHARNMLAELQLGIRRPKAPKFEDAMGQFIAKHCQAKNRPSTAAETERLLRKGFLPALRHLTLDEIASQRITRILDDMLDTPSAARHAFVAIRSFFRWCAKRGMIAVSPIAMMDAPTEPVSRDRVLSDDELRAVYQSAVLQGCTGGTIVRLLILTGQRRGEIAGLRAEWIDRSAKTITLPAEVTKNGRTHTFPFGDLAGDLLAHSSEEGLLFPARGKLHPYNGWSKLKMSVNPDIDPWTLHDLRRTFATGLASLEVPPHIIERILNHAGGRISGVASIYNRFSYLEEMRSAIKKWEAKVQALLPPTWG